MGSDCQVIVNKRPLQLSYKRLKLGAVFSIKMNIVLAAFECSTHFRIYYLNSFGDSERGEDSPNNGRCPGTTNCHTVLKMRADSRI